MAPFFSIITPVLNGVYFVNSYVASLQGQTFLDWEAIVVDDGSSDGTIDILQKKVKADYRFKLVKSYPKPCKRERQGPYLPRNYGLSISNGKYICFLDIDDYWLPFKLLDQYNLLSQKPGLKLLFANYYKADSKLSLGYLKPRLDIVPIKLQSLMWNPIPNLTSCVSRDVALMFRFKPIGHEDFLYWHEIILSVQSSEIGKTRKILAIYRSSGQSTSANKLKMLNWWMNCYRIMGHSFGTSLLLLLVKSTLEFAERFAVAVGLIPTIPLAKFSGQDRLTIP